MSLTKETKAAYELVLQDLEADRQSVRQEMAALQQKIREIDSGIGSLRRKMLPADGASANAGGRPVDESGMYSYISVRWAVLHVLSEASAPMATAEIADKLAARGIRTRAANFANNVSSVLSSTMTRTGEVETIDGAWRLTPKGVDDFKGISSTPKFHIACQWF